jgi:3D (Asp-Asp-Asp) domain-containing protein
VVLVLGLWSETASARMSHASTKTGSSARGLRPDFSASTPQAGKCGWATHGHSSQGKMKLASITSYWSRGCGTDRWTRRGQSSTGEPLRRGVVAVDPRVIPYGSLVKIEGVRQTFLALDTGTAVCRRRAAIRSARTWEERRAIVVDVFFPTEREGRAFDQSLPKFVKVTYFPPKS